MLLNMKDLSCVTEFFPVISKLTSVTDNIFPCVLNVLKLL